MLFKDILVFLQYCSIFILTQAQYTYFQSEAAVGCYNGLGTCTDELKCIDGCMDCYRNPYACKACRAGYFLFTLPQDDLLIGVKTGEQICVPCPFKEYDDPYTRYCGDCLQNSNSWESSRVCTFDYKVLSSNAATDTLHQMQRDQPLLFFVMRYPQDKGQNLLFANPYQTVLCEGCQQFCDIPSQTCLPRSSIFNFDIAMKYISCQQGYSYSNALAECVQCPQNCDSCKITDTISWTYDESADELVQNVDVQKDCILCSNGYFMFSSYVNDGSDYQYSCELCFDGCDSCYFGSDTVNLNTNYDKWELYADILQQYNHQQAPKDIYHQLEQKYNINLRCTKCSIVGTTFYLPSLDQKQCEQCTVLCDQCEYVSYDAELQNKPLQYPTQNGLVVLDPTEKAKYVKRCRKCIGYPSTFTLDGTTCTSCNDIANCLSCYYEVGGMTTLDRDFTPSKQSGNLVCALCNSTYTISQDKKSCISQTITVKNCLSQNFKKECQMCNVGFTLNQNLNQCEQGCGLKIGDFFCNTCYKYTELSTKVSVTRCHQCMTGYYIDIFTGKCKPCSQDPTFITCSECYQYTQKEVYQSRILAMKPHYTTTDLQSYALTDGTPKLVCTTCETQSKATLNPYTGQCEVCLSNCATGMCNFDSAFTFCMQCQSTLTRSGDKTKTDCLVCPDGCIGCQERTSDQITSINPYFNPSSSNLALFTNVCYLCLPGYSFNGALSRCVQCIQGDVCYLEMKMDAYFYCQTGAEDRFNLDSTRDQRFQNLPDYFASQTETKAYISLFNFENSDNLLIMNQRAISTVIMNIGFIQTVDPNNNRCLFNKDVTFTTSLFKNVFSLMNVKINIFPVNEQLQKIDGISQIEFYIAKNFNFEYFTEININGFNIYPAYSLYEKLSETQSQLEKKYTSLLPSPFGFSLLQNIQSSFSLTNSLITQYKAQKFYLHNDTYVKPQQNYSLDLKKRSPFSINLLNTANFTLENVTIRSFSYLVDREVKFSQNIFEYSITKTLGFYYVQWKNVNLEDIAIERHSFLQMNNMQFYMKTPDVSQNVFLQDISLKNMYFQTGSAFMQQELSKVQSAGNITVVGFTASYVEHNNSNALFTFSTAQVYNVENIKVIDNTVNNSQLLTTNTINLQGVLIQNSIFTNNGRFFQSSYRAQAVTPTDSLDNGLQFIFNNGVIQNIQCVTINCIALVFSPANDYFLQTNVTINNLWISDVKSNGFPTEFKLSANSAIFYIEKVNVVKMSNFTSHSNKNLTVLNMNSIQRGEIDQFTCFNEEFDVNNVLKQQNIDPDNLCLYFSDFYQGGQISNLNLTNLIGVDNSFIFIDSWLTVLQNTTTSTGFTEYVNISLVNVQNNLIIVNSISSTSAPLIIRSEQQQRLYIEQVYFANNQHIQNVISTLTPTTSTMLVQGQVCNLILRKSIWQNNSVEGTAGVLYLSVGTATLSEVTMMNSNWDQSDQFYSNSQSRGGHLYMLGYNLTILDSEFMNATGYLGGALYLKTVKEGEILLRGVNFTWHLTQIKPSPESRGGCVYIDTSGSQSSMVFDNVNMDSCFSRGEGGCIYMKSSANSQDLYLNNSIFQNCYALAGTFFKVVYDARTTETQLTTFNQISVSQKESNYREFMKQISIQNPDSGLSLVELYLFVQRASAIEQDSGYIVITNSFFDGILFVSSISVNQPRQFTINQVTIADGVIMYRPSIEIILPFLNPTEITKLTFTNMTSYTVEYCQQINKTLGINYQTAECTLLQAKIEYPNMATQNSLFYIQGVTDKAPLIARGVFIGDSICEECYSGLFTVLQAYKGDKELELITLQDISCIGTQSGYYGCIFITSEQSLSPAKSPDEKILLKTFESQYNLDLLIQASSNQPKASRIIKEKLIAKYNESIITVRELVTVDIVQQTEAFIPKNLLSANVRIQDGRFTNNKALYGAAIAIKQLFANITSIQCKENVAESSGGCIYFEADPLSGPFVQQRLNLLNNQFIHNNASIGGAIRAINSHPSHLNKSQCLFVSNKAHIYGDIYASVASKIAISFNSSLSIPQSLNPNKDWLPQPIMIKSGQLLGKLNSQQITVLLLDEYDQIVKYQLQSTSSITSNPAKSITGSGQRVFNTICQGFNLTDLVIYHDPYQSKTLQGFIQSDAIYIPRYSDKPPYFLLEFDQNYTLTVRIRSVECLIGESYDQTDKSCSPCGPGSYSLVAKQFCKSMDEVTMNETYLNKISIFPGYWRSTNEIDSIAWCINQPVLCKGGWDSGDDSCLKGHIGALCEACDLYGVKWGESYSNADKFICAKCSLAKNNELLIAFISIITLVQIVMSIKSTKEKLELLILDDVCTLFNWSKSSKPTSNTGNLMKILNNYLFIIQALTTFNLAIPDGVTKTVETAGAPAKGLASSLDCLLIKNFDVDDLYWRTIWTHIMQIIYITSILLGLLVLHLSKKLPFKMQYVNTMFIYMFLLLHPNYVQEFIMMVSKRHISDMDWVQSNVSYDYNTNTHQQWMFGLGWPGLITWMVILPLSLLYILYDGNKRKKLSNFIFRQSWGFFYNEYKQEAYFWEFVRIFQKELIVFILSFYIDQIIIKAIFVFLVVFLYTRATTSYQPYELQTLNYIDQISSNCLMVSMIVGVLIYESKNKEIIYIYGIGFTLISLINFFFIVLLIGAMIRLYLIQFADKLDKIRDKVIEKKPELMNIQWLHPYLVNKQKMNAIAVKKWKEIRVMYQQAKLRYRRKGPAYKLQFKPLSDTLRMTIHTAKQFQNMRDLIVDEDSMDKMELMEKNDKQQNAPFSLSNIENDQVHQSYRSDEYPGKKLANIIFFKVMEDEQLNIVEQKEESKPKQVKNEQTKKE